MSRNAMSRNIYQSLSLALLIVGAILPVGGRAQYCEGYVDSNCQDRTIFIYGDPSLTVGECVDQCNTGNVGYLSYSGPDDSGQQVDYTCQPVGSIPTLSRSKPTSRPHKH